MESKQLSSKSRARANNDVVATPIRAITIERVKLVDLFGLYSYDIPSTSECLDRVSILYGENGVGKTNILRILFHLLSPAGDRGHRTALAKIKFRSVEVLLSNGTLVSGKRTGDKLGGGLRFEVARHLDAGPELLGAWNWFPGADRTGESLTQHLPHLDLDRLRSLSPSSTAKERSKAIENFVLGYIVKESDPRESEDAFLRALKEHVPPIYFLTADRILSADQVSSDPASTYEREMRGGMRPEAMLTKGREHALNETISTASRSLSRLAVQATRQGTKSMHSIYQELLRRLASRASRKKQNTPQQIEDLTLRLGILSAKYDLYAKYGLAPQLQGEALVALLENVRASEKSVAVEVLRPYVESLTEQANSIDAAYSAIDTLMSTFNEFLYDKQISFSLGDGMMVTNKLGEILEPSDLSSGEQQLLLLFCHITIAQDSGGIFIVDEPEISLNIKWQRRLIDALLRLDRANNLQFILASHSMEILTRHHDNVVPLQDVGNA